MTTALNRVTFEQQGARHIVSRVQQIGERLRVYYLCTRCGQEFALNGRTPRAQCDECSRFA